MLTGDKVSGKKAKFHFISQRFIPVNIIENFAVKECGFNCEKSKVGTLMINKTSETLENLTISESPEFQKKLLEANSADYLRDWWNKVYKKYNKELLEITNKNN